LLLTGADWLRVPLIKVVSFRPWELRTIRGVPDRGKINVK
jgi:hypothetical protein